MRLAPHSTRGDRWLTGALLMHAALLTVLLIPARLWALALLLAVAQTLPVLWARRAPVAALVVHLAVKPFTYLAGLPVGELAWIALCYLLGRHRPFRVSFPSMVVTALLVPLLMATISLHAAVSVGVLVGLLQLGAAWGLGVALGRATRNAARLEEEREQQRLRDLLTVERARIGSELHEVAAQRLRRIEAQAGALAQTTPTVEQLHELKQECGATLTALRRMLGLLRSDAPEVPADSAIAATACPEPARRTHWRRLVPRAGDLLLVLAVGVAAALLHLWLAGTALNGGSAAFSAFLYLPSTLTLPSTLPGMLALLAQVLALAWRRSAPVSALLVATAGLAVAPLVTGNHLAGVLAWLVLVYSVAAWRRPPWSMFAVLFALAGWIFGVTAGAAAEAAMTQGPNSAVYGGLLLLGLYAAGDLRRRSLEATETARRSARQRRLTERLRAERSRVARELHDQVSHHVSGMAVQAGAVRTIAHSRPELAVEALTEIRDNARTAQEALPKLLHALGMTERAEADPEEPGLLDETELNELVAPLRAAGAEVAVRLRGDPSWTAGERALFAARVVQEAVRNVLRHAGASATRVLVEHRQRQTVVEVIDAGPVPDHQGGAGCGQGLAGMRERVALVNGRLQVGSHAGGWRVRAILPR